MMDGALQHKDSLDSGSVMRPGDVQRISVEAEIDIKALDGAEFLLFDMA